VAPYKTTKRVQIHIVGVYPYGEWPNSLSRPSELEGVALDMRYTCTMGRSSMERRRRSYVVVVHYSLTHAYITIASPTTARSLIRAGSARDCAVNVPTVLLSHCTFSTSLAGIEEASPPSGRSNTDPSIVHRPSKDSELTIDQLSKLAAPYRPRGRGLTLAARSAPFRPRLNLHRRTQGEQLR